jgi:hypothetical protein
MAFTNVLQQILPRRAFLLCKGVFLYNEGLIHSIVAKT